MKAERERSLLGQPSQVLSPLRYPGSKRRQSLFIGEVLKANAAKGLELVEPFAGGASVSLFLLKNKLVLRTTLGEKDPLVAAFWRVVISEPEALVAKVRETKPSVALWKKWRKVHPTTDLDKAFKCLFLNRTSFGGVLAERTGPIGGASQEGDYKVDCRYSAETTTARITDCHRLLEGSSVVEGTYATTLQRVKRRLQPDDYVTYLDPPFFLKADRLYAHYFSLAQHKRFHTWMANLKGFWILSYDAAPEIEKLYADLDTNTKKLHIRYTSASHGERNTARELVITNFPHLPPARQFVRRDPRTEGRNGE